MSFILIERTKITAVRVFADDDKLLQIRNKVIACSFKENKTYNVTAVYRGIYG